MKKSLIKILPYTNLKPDKITKFISLRCLLKYLPSFLKSDQSDLNYLKFLVI